MDKIFRTEFGERIFKHKYRHKGCGTWDALAKTLVNSVLTNGRTQLSAYHKPNLQYTADIIANMQFIPAGRYLYYAGRSKKYFNNCQLYRVEHDTREEWAALVQRVTAALMTGAGIGVDYSIIRPKGTALKSTGGVASGALSLIEIVNEIGRRVQQGGSRRSAMYASLNWQHGDIQDFLKIKDWAQQFVQGTNGRTVAELKEADFNYNAPLDMTNISINYDDSWLALGDAKAENETFIENCTMACRNGEPGFAFNFGNKQYETLRNACTEITSEDDSDVCNLGSVHMGNIETIDEFYQVCYHASQFLYYGSVNGKVSTKQTDKIRTKNRRLGLGLMGVHEWLIKRGYRYEMNPELASWMEVYRQASESGANAVADALGFNRPKGYRAIAPTGSISILAGTTGGIEPIFAVAYKRRFLSGNKTWKYQYVVDGSAKILIDQFGINPNDIETSFDLALDVERRIQFQADMQEYVDHAISSTINLPNWGSEYNNEETVPKFADILAKYANRLRGFTAYPNGSRGGQPLTPVPYEDAIHNCGNDYEEVFSDACIGGVCGA